MTARKNTSKRAPAKRTSRNSSRLSAASYDARAEANALRVRHNPTRRQGPRTGAIPANLPLVDKIMEAVVGAGRPTREGLVYTYFDGYVPLGYFSVESYATGELKLWAVKLKHSESFLTGGITGGIREDYDSHPTAAERVARVREALRRIRATASEEEVRRISDKLPALKVEPVLWIGISDKPVDDADLEEIRHVVAHELAHASDEHVFKRLEAFGEEEKANYDTHMVAHHLRLRHPVGTALKISVDEYLNDPVEVTAFISQIMSEVGSFDQELAAWHAKRKELGRPAFASRHDELIAFLKYRSAVFNLLSEDWTPKTTSRVLRAIWDRYHDEESFPKATGVLKNRRSSRRRSSRQS